MIVNSRTLNKIISRSENLQQTLLDLTEDTVDETNLSRGETAHDKEGDGVIGRFQIDDAEAWAIGTRNGVLVGEDDITYHNNSKYYSQMSEAAATVSGSAMMVAGSHADRSELSALASADSALMSENYEIISGSYMNIAGSYMNIAGERAEDSEAFAMGKRGGALVPPSDPTYHNNSKYYYEQSKSIAESLAGVLRPKGTCLFADLPAISDSQSGDVWNIEDEFTTTSDFREGAGRIVAAGSNVYLTVDHQWDVLAGTTSDYIGATSSTAAIHGLVNPAQAGEENHVFHGDGTWQPLPVFRGISGSIQSISGMLPAAESGDEDKVFNGRGEWGKRLQIDIVTQNGQYGYINANNEFVAFTSQADIDAALDVESTKPIQNQAVANPIEAMVNLYGSKNLLPSNGYAEIASGIIYTVNADGSITATGTASAPSYFQINGTVHLKSYLKAGERYILTGCPEGGSSDTYCIYNGYISTGFIDTGDGYEFTMPSSGYVAEGIMYIMIRPAAGNVNLTFYPMIRDSRITDPTYVPYAMTNREITEQITAWNSSGAIFKSMGRISGSTSANETRFMDFPAGSYMVTVDDTNYFPTRWGTLMLFKTGDYYNTMLFSATNGDLYFRNFYLPDHTYYTNWRKITNTII